MVIQLIPGKLETSCASMHKATWETKKQPLLQSVILQQSTVDLTLRIADLPLNTPEDACSRGISEMLNIG
jgi:hypothetical protein